MESISPDFKREGDRKPASSRDRREGLDMVTDDAGLSQEKCAGFITGVIRVEVWTLAA